jgi:fermentation-respiration switch protein FrsA (DUF1100 family)
MLIILKPCWIALKKESLLITSILNYMLAAAGCIQPYLMSWFRYDPIREIKKVKIPLLILQGTTDIQVTVTDAEKLKKANSEPTLVIVNGMNHILKEAPADRSKTLPPIINPISR